MSQQQNDARMSVLSSSARAAAEWSPRKPSSPPLLPIGKERAASSSWVATDR
ncbi:hypothetical protein PTI98_003790 [Pleurotus ostreatus]|nr:hypothetical protein PTI98_003790 [Pleurotus ostreatus]